MALKGQSRFFLTVSIKKEVETNTMVGFKVTIVQSIALLLYLECLHRGHPNLYFI